MPATDPRPRPAIYRDVAKFHAALIKASEAELIGGDTLYMYRGHPSKLFKKLKINPRYYTPINKILRDTGVVEVLQRGSAERPSIWAVRAELPPQENWPVDLTGPNVSATMKVELERRITALEAWRENLTGGGFNITEALRDFELRLTKLEGELAKMKLQTHKRNTTKGK